MPTSIILLGVLTSAAVFAGVFVPFYAVFRFPVAAEPPIHRRVAQAVGLDRATLFETPILAPFMGLVLAVASRLHWPALRLRIRRDLEAAGNPMGYSVDQYIALCLACAVLAMACGILLDRMLMGGASLFFTLPFFLCVGFYVPLATLSGAAHDRLTRIGKQLPYTLDLVALVVAAGSSFTEAVETLIRDDPDSDLNQELRIVLAEISFGATRANALSGLADRIPQESLRSVVGAINQAERLGTPLAAILKTQAGMIRMHRSVRAEKLAASAGLRILVPTMIILLAIMALVLVPFGLSIIQNKASFF